MFLLTLKCQEQSRLKAFRCLRSSTNVFTNLQSIQNSTKSYTCKKSFYLKASRSPNESLYARLQLFMWKILFSENVLEFNDKKELSNATNTLGAMENIFQRISKLKLPHHSFMCIVNNSLNVFY